MRAPKKRYVPLATYEEQMKQRGRSTQVNSNSVQLERANNVPSDYLSKGISEYAKLNTERMCAVIAIRGSWNRGPSGAIIESVEVRPPKVKIWNAKKHDYFSELPGELRNKIYDLVYAETTLIELASKRGYRLQDSSHGPKLRRIKVEGQYNKSARYLFQDQRATNWQTSMPALYLVNKLFHGDCIGIMYTRINVFSQGPLALCRFLATANPAHTGNIRHLTMDHITYGSPRLMMDEVWKTKHDERWARTCLQAATTLKLETLHITIDVRDEPFRMHLKEPWVQPLLCFAKASTQPTLKSVNIKILSKLRYITAVNLQDNCAWVNYHPSHVLRMQANEKACRKVHDLFGDAIARKIMGETNDERAMKPFLDFLRARHCSAFPQPAWRIWLN